MRRPHDAFLKPLYRAGARDAITLFFPDQARHIDWESLQWIEKEILIPGQPSRSVVADLVGQTRDREGRYLEVLIHPEIQMRPDAEMDWRAFQYSTGGIQKRRIDLDFHGESVHVVGYWSAGIGDLNAEEYAESDNPMAWALAAWMRQRRGGRVELRLRLLDKVLRFVQDGMYRKLLLDTVRSYFTLNRVEQAEEQRLLTTGAYGEVREMLQTELGRLEAAAERRGEVRGRREELQNVLQEILLDRFPIAAEGLAARVDRVRQPAVLRRLILRAAAAKSIEEIERLLPPLETE